MGINIHPDVNVKCKGWHALCQHDLFQKSGFWSWISLRMRNLVGSQQLICCGFGPGSTPPSARHLAEYEHTRGQGSEPCG
eukprot:3222597-Rhodomonas_salina.2